MHHDKSECLPGDPPLTLFHLHLLDDALAMPAAGRFVPGPPGLLDAQGDGGGLLAPPLQFLAYGTRARH